MSARSSAGSIAKVLVVGNVATGKSSIIRRYTKNEFSSDYQTTIGVDFSLKVVNSEGIDIKIQLWDIAGQDRFAGLSRVFYTHAVGAIVVFDIFDRDTFNSASMWKKDIDSKIFLPNGDGIPVILLANKCDLIAEKKPSITSEQIQQFCQQNDFIASFEVSAKTGANIKEACQLLVDRIVQNNKKLKKDEPNSASNNSGNNSSSDASSSSTSESPQTIRLGSNRNEEEKKGKGCC